MTQRYTLLIAAQSNDTWGWNGWVKDTLTGKCHSLIKTVVDYVLDGEVGCSHCAFDTRAELLAAAKRKARALAGASK